VAKAKLGRDEELSAIARLDAQARAIERQVSGASFAALIAEERVRSPDYGGRSVFSVARSQPGPKVVRRP
jgi:hypothetical protein